MLSNDSVSLENGDVIRSSENGMVKLHFEQDNIQEDYIIGPSSELKVKEDQNGNKVLVLEKGKINVAHTTLDEAITETVAETVKNTTNTVLRRIKQRAVITPTVVIAVRGTNYALSYDTLHGTEIIVIEGSVDIMSINNGNSITIEAGYKGILTPDGTLQGPIKTEDSSIEKWWEIEGGN